RSHRLPLQSALYCCRSLSTTFTPDITPSDPQVVAIADTDTPSPETDSAYRTYDQYVNESHSQSQSNNNNNNNHSSQSIKRERSDSDDDSDNEPLSKKLSKSVKKEDSDDEYSPKKETKVKTEKKEVKKEPKKEPKSKKRKKESDYDSEYNSEDEDYGRKKSSKKKSKSYSDDDDDDYKDSKSKKKAKSGKNDKKSDTKKKSVKKEVTSSPEKSPTKKKVKKEENEEHIWKWWEEERPGEGIKWKTLTHKGPVFPPPYEPLPKSWPVYSDDEYSPKKETKVKTEKKEVKKEPKKEPKSKKRKKESDYDSEYNSDDEDYGRKKSSKKKSKSYSDDDDDDYKDSKSKKKAKSGKNDKKSDSKKKSVKKEVTSSPEKSPTKKKVKKEENEEHIWKWWEEERPGEGIKWKTLTHKGPVFPPPYEPLPKSVKFYYDGKPLRLKPEAEEGPVFPPPYEPLPKSVKFYYDGKPLRLKPEAEEVAGFYARMLDHDYVAKPAFNKNFFKDWRKTMTEDEKQTISDLKKCNFKDMATHFKEESEKRKQKTKEEKQEIKKQNEKLIEEYGYCIVDGHKQKIGNFRIEPPGLFRGRGEHPKMGKLKKRVRPEDVIINIGKKVDPPAPPTGRKWKEVRHDNTVTWLASWQENVMGNVKYIMLNPSSKLKSIKDWQKYEKARELKKYISKIRDDYRIDFKAREMVKRQRAVALYFIDKLALRAGNEKEEGETADTVGCCSLRVEHIKLHDKKNGKEYVVDFDFLGKDSIRYENSVSVEKRVYKNLKHFMESKKGSDDLFDRIDTAELNRYLTSLMDGLTAKVFRTYNASQTLQLQLNELTKSSMSLPEKILAYNRANRAVALLCNHQRAVPKTFDKQMENLEVKIKDKKKVVKEAKKNYKEAKKNKDNAANVAKFKKRMETLEDQLEKLEAKKNKDNAANVAKFKKRMETLEDQLEKLVLQRTDKEENKQIALGTSKLNYLDPRITVAWCKKWDVSIEKVYNKTQRDKFRWAIEMVGPEYQF
ncbi:unnamed protein product, partial [Medioppia subpectinata]